MRMSVIVVVLAIGVAGFMYWNSSGTGGAAAVFDRGQTKLAVSRGSHPFVGELTYQWSRHTIVKIFRTYADGLKRARQLERRASDVGLSDWCRSIHSYWNRFADHFIRVTARGADGFWFADITRLLLHQPRSSTAGQPPPPPPPFASDPFVNFYHTRALTFYTNLMDHMLPALTKHLGAACNERHTDSVRIQHPISVSEYFDRGHSEVEQYFMAEEMSKIRTVTTEWLPPAVQRAVFNRMSQSAQTTDVRTRWLEFSLLLFM